MTKAKPSRPLSVGDVLVHQVGPRTTVMSYDIPIARAYVYRGWTHADGAPIDVGITQESEAAADAVSAPIDAGITLQESEAAAAAVFEATAATLRDATTAMRDIAELNNRLSDACGALRTERDELLRENAVLRRRLERERKS